MTQKDKVLNCSNCRIGDFKRSLCDCHNGFCARYKGIGTEKDFFMAIEELSEPSGDRISRVDAIKAVWNAYADAINFGDSGEEIASDIDIILSALPSAEPKTGEWILVCDSEGEGDNLYRCSECGCEYGCQEYDKPNFCLDCGAKMFKKDGELK